MPASRVLWIVLAVLAAGRVALAFDPSMAVWGANTARFVPRPWAVALLALPVIALVPFTVRPVAAWLDRRRFGGVLTQTVLIVGAALMVVSLPDRVWLTGDFLGRQYSLDAPGEGLAWYSHAMPLDVLLHQRLGSWCVTHWGIASADFGRWLGAAEAALAAWVALRFALTLGLEGAPAAAVTAIAFWGGWLALFTGYNKALSEMALVTGSFGVLGLSVIRERRRAIPLSLVMSAGLLLHRSALALLPAFVLAVWPASGGGLAGPSRRAPGRRWLPLAIPVLVVACLAPSLVGIIEAFDLALLTPFTHHAASAPRSDTRALDLLNALLLLCPLVVALPLFALRGRSGLGRPETRFLGALVAGPLAVALVFYPPEGLFRFWDILVVLGVALSFVTAWVVAEMVSTPRWRWLSVAIVLGSGCPSLLWLLHNSDATMGFARVRAFLDEPPRRAPEVMANTHEFLGFRLVDAGRPAEAAREFELAAEVVPSPRVLRQWATAEMMAGNPAATESILRRAVERDPSNISAWRELANHAAWMRDTSEAVRALEVLVQLTPDDPVARAALREMTSGTPASEDR